MQGEVREHDEAGKPEGDHRGGTGTGSKGKGVGLLYGVRCYVDGKTTCDETRSGKRLPMIVSLLVKEYGDK